MTSADLLYDSRRMLIIFPIIIFLALILIAILGNVLVVISVVKFPRLKSQTCFHILASLAVADIFVCLIVVPLSVLSVWTEKWPLGANCCLAYMSFDVMFCTASILHLCLVAFDRYLAISKPLKYTRIITPLRIKLLIALAWIVSVIISFVPIFNGWFRDPTTEWPIKDTNVTCDLKVNTTYAVISSVTSFYFPVVVICGLYMKIVCIAVKKSKQIHQDTFMGGMNVEKRTPHNFLCCCARKSSLDKSSPSKNPFIGTYHLKAVKTVGLLVGCFLFCWQPFFVIYLIKPSCGSCNIPQWLDISAIWIGYVNSGINPFLYCYLQKEFRAAFKRIWLNTCNRTKFHCLQWTPNSTSTAGNDANMSTALYLNTYVSINHLVPVSGNSPGYETERNERSPYKGGRTKPPIIRRTKPNSVMLTT